MSVSDAEASGLLGRRVGEVIVRNEGSWQEQRWTVEQIEPALAHAVRDAMEHYEERFPREAFFLTRFQVGQDPSIRDLAPIIASLREQQEAIRRVVTTYREQMLPLGIVATTLHRSIGDVMEYLSQDPDAPLAILAVEWGDRTRQDESCAAASQAKEIVITRSALKTAADLDLLETLAANYTVVAPRTLRDEVAVEVRAAEEFVANGRAVLQMTPGGPRLVEFTPGHAVLVQHLEATRRLLNWLDQSVRIEVRPLESIGRMGSDEEEGRDFIGHSSYDAFAVAGHAGAPMYADDLGLRRLEINGRRPRSFSTIALLQALAEREVLTAEERDEQLVTLVTRQYGAVRPTRELLSAALRRETEIGQLGVRRAFSVLGRPGVEPAEAARVAVSLAKTVFLTPVQVVPPDTVVRLALEAMSLQWPLALCSYHISRVAEEELALLPQQLLAVRRVCEAFVRPRIAGPQ
jgi:hypothetical protein